MNLKKTIIILISSVVGCATQSDFPYLAVSINSIQTTSQGLRFTGSHLNEIMNIQIQDQNEKFPLKILQSTPSLLTTSLATPLGLSLGVGYFLLIKTANGTTSSIPISITIPYGKSLDATGFTSQNTAILYIGKDPSSTDDTLILQPPGASNSSHISFQTQGPNNQSPKTPTQPTGITTVEAMRIASTGYVGIGTQTPQNPLDVSGTISATTVTTSSITSTPSLNSVGSLLTTTNFNFGSGSNVFTILGKNGSIANSVTSSNHLAITSTDLSAGNNFQGMFMGIDNAS